MLVLLLVKVAYYTVQEIPFEELFNKLPETFVCY